MLTLQNIHLFMDQAGPGALEGTKITIAKDGMTATVLSGGVLFPIIWDETERKPKLRPRETKKRVS